MTHICNSQLSWWLHSAGKHIDEIWRKTVLLLYVGALTPHSRKWVIPTRGVWLGRGTGWPYFVNHQIAPKGMLFSGQMHISSALNEYGYFAGNASPSDNGLIHFSQTFWVTLQANDWYVSTVYSWWKHELIWRWVNHCYTRDENIN